MGLAGVTVFKHLILHFPSLDDSAQPGLLIGPQLTGGVWNVGIGEGDMSKAFDQDGGSKPLSHNGMKGAPTGVAHRSFNAFVNWL